MKVYGSEKWKRKEVVFGGYAAVMFEYPRKSSGLASLNMAFIKPEIQKNTKAKG